MEVGNKFIDEHGRELELTEINDIGEYVVSYYSEEEGQWVVSVYEKEELDRMKRLL